MRSTECGERLVHACQEASRTLTRLLPRRELLRSITHLAVQLMHADGAALAARRPGGSQLLLEAVEGRQPLGAPLVVEEGLITEIVRQNRILIDDDYPASPYALEQVVAAGVHVVAGAPLVLDGTPVGALMVGYWEPDYQLTTADRHILAMLATHAAAALRNAELHDRVRAARARLQSILEFLPVGVMLFDENGHVTECNPAAAEIIGTCPGPQLSPHDHARLFAFRHPDGTPYGCEEVPSFRAVRGETVRGEEVHHATADGREVITLVSAAPLRDPNGAIRESMVAFQDITHRAEVERLKSEFLNIASHELRTPLTPLRLLLQQSLRRVRRLELLDPRVVERMLRQTDRLTEMVGDLLDVSRLENGRLTLHPVRLDLRPLVNGIVEDFRRQAPDRTITASVPHDPVVAAADPGRIEQVLANLVDNALKYSSREETVDVRLDHAAEHLRVVVVDHGSGIPPDQQGAIFSRFYRARTGVLLPRQGLGLGLYLSREIVERHGGTIGFETVEGQGSTFFFTLPRLE